MSGSSQLCWISVTGDRHGFTKMAVSPLIVQFEKKNSAYSGALDPPTRCQNDVVNDVTSHVVNEDVTNDVIKAPEPVSLWLPSLCYGRYISKTMR